MTGIFIQACSQLTGINFIFYYGTTFFQRSGIQNPYTVSVITDVVNVVSTLPGIWAIDRIGRRKLLIGGAIGMCVCEFLVAIIGVTIGQPQSDGTINTSAQRSLIAFTCIYIFFFASTWGPCVWTITGEIFALPVRAKSMGFAVASNWLWNFAIGYATPYLVDPSTTGPQGIKAANLGVMVFFLWGSTCAFCVVFAFFFVPELAGLSLEQVDVLYRESSIVGSNKFRKQLLAEQGTGLTPRDETRLEMGQRTSDSLQADEDKTRDAHLD
jgi:MFS family permease